MFGIDSGPSKQEKTQYGELSSASGFATGMGESNLTSSSNFMKAILSGDATKISQALAPQISALKSSVSQDQKTSAMQGNRSGGTTAGNLASSDKVHGDITNMTGQLTGSSASSLASTGSNLLSTGMSGNEAAFGEAKTMQDQNSSKWNDIIDSIGKSAGSIAGMMSPTSKVGKGLSSFGSEFGG